MILYTQTLNEYESERSIVIIISIMKDELIALSEMRSNIHVHGSFTLRKDDCPLSSLGEKEFAVAFTSKRQDHLHDRRNHDTYSVFGESVMGKRLMPLSFRKEGEVRK
jgi:hypothetical protein